MFPNTYLPLNIFEPRYLKMIDEALATDDRLIGMIQPIAVKDELRVNLHKVGCAGKIIKFEEVKDSRYLITLKGLSRFNLIKETTNNDNFKVAEIENLELSSNNINNSLPSCIFFIDKGQTFIINPFNV